MSTPPPKEVAGLSQTDWDEVHTRIQALLVPLAEHVCERLPEVRSQPGRTGAKKWFLYSYLDFTWPNEDEGETEAIVAGVTFSASKGDRICVQGDIGGGETGHTYYEIEKRVIPLTRVGALTAAQEIAGQLSKQVEVVVNALRERRTPPDYRRGALTE